MVDVKSREGRLVVLLIGLLIEFLLVLALAAAVAVYYEQGYGGVLLHVVIGALAPWFGYVDGLHTLAFTAIIIAYQLEDAGINKKDLAAYATGFAVSALIMTFGRYFWKPSDEPVVYYSSSKQGL
jgi:hypothetical protein